jgi:hypothetical protein
VPASYYGAVATDARTPVAGVELVVDGGVVVTVRDTVTGEWSGFTIS